MRNFLFLFSIAVFVLESCNAFYVPASTHVPILHGKKDFSQDFSIGGSQFYEAVSYSPFNHFYAGGTGHFCIGKNDNHLSGGPHIGCYANPFSGAMHLNLQTGCGWGNSSVEQLHNAGDANYFYYYVQGFIAGKTSQSKNSYIGAGAGYDFANLRYSHTRFDYNGSPGYMPPTEGFFSPFIYFQKGFSNNPNANFYVMVGYKFEEPRLDNTYGVFGWILYEPLTFHIGWTYQIQFGKNKSDASAK